MTSPTYNDIFKTDFGGKLPTDIVQGAPSYNLKDPLGQSAYGMTLGAGGAGADLTGVRAFLGSYNPLLEQDQFGQYKGNIEPLKGLAAQIGYDTSGYDMSGSELGTSKLYNDLEAKLKDYHYIGGMSAGWDNQGDIRGGARTLYKDDGSGTLNPVTSPAFRHVDDKGNWWQENPDALAALSIIGGAGLAAWLSPVAAAAGDAAATVGGATAAAAPSLTTAGTTAASTGAGLSGVSGSIASALGPEVAGFWGGLPAWGQAGITGALQGGVTSGLQGKNIIKGALMGGLSGGVGAWAGPAISELTGLPAWGGKALASAGLGGLTSGSWQGALGSGLASLGTSGLSGAGVPSQLAGLISRYGTNAVMGALGGSSSAGGGAAAQGGGGGLSGGVSGGGGGAGGGSNISALLAGAGGLGGQTGTGADTEAAFMKASYGPMLAEEAKKKQAQRVRDLLEEDA